MRYRQAPMANRSWQVANGHVRTGRGKEMSPEAQCRKVVLAAAMQAGREIRVASDSRTLSRFAPPPSKVPVRLPLSALREQFQRSTPSALVASARLAQVLIIPSHDCLLPRPMPRREPASALGHDKPYLVSSSGVTTNSPFRDAAVT